MLTHLAFRETSVGEGKARRPFAPSLDRIDPGEPCSRRNCRLVLQAVNFALNAWGMTCSLPSRKEQSKSATLRPIRLSADDDFSGRQQAS